VLAARVGRLARPRTKRDMTVARQVRETRAPLPELVGRSIALRKRACLIPSTTTSMADNKTRTVEDSPELASDRPTKKAKVDQNDVDLDLDLDNEEVPMEEVNAAGASDLYLDTVHSFHIQPSFELTESQVNRAVLDFDFEKVCSVSSSNINVYACLVCGKYFQGRGRKSPAYAHSIHDDHHVFMNLGSTKVSSL
jgi:hypothetical protein